MTHWALLPSQGKVVVGASIALCALVRVLRGADLPTRSPRGGLAHPATHGPPPQHEN